MIVGYSMPTREDLKYYQALPLDMKIAKTKDNIREFVRQFGVDDVYVSFSGGKDSTVLLDIARKMYPEIEAVFVNTGLEYPVSAAEKNAPEIVGILHRGRWI